MSGLITASRLKTARSCAREHHYRYNLCIRPRETTHALSFGTAMHKALEVWWSARTEERLGVALDTVDSLALEPFDRAAVRALMIGYEARWGDAGLMAIAVEAEFVGPLVNPATGHESRTWRKAGKIDVIARDEAGETVTIEHKTSAEDISPGSPYWRRLVMDAQVSLYFDGAALLGHDVSRCIYDVIGKPDIRPLKATPEESRKYTKTGTLHAKQRATDETPDEYEARLLARIEERPGDYYQRGDVVRLDADLQDARADVWSVARQIRENEVLNRHPRNPDACVRYGSACPYFDVCSRAASLQDSRFVQLDSPHPELSSATQPKQPKEEAA